MGPSIGDYLEPYEVLWDADWGLLARKVGLAVIAWEKERDANGRRFVLMSDGETIRYLEDGEHVLPINPGRTPHKRISRGGSFGEPTDRPDVLFAWMVRDLE